MLADHISRSHLFESVSINTMEQGWYLRGTISEFYSRIEVDENSVLEEQMDIYEQTMIYDDDDMRLSRYSFRTLERYTEVALTNLVIFDSSSNVIWAGAKRLTVTNQVWYDDKDSPSYLANILMREMVNELCEEWTGLTP